jgi:hypothetical protein
MVSYQFFSQYRVQPDKDISRMPFQISKELKRIVQQILHFCLRVACRQRPRLTNISWISDNIKTRCFSRVQYKTDDIWKKIINKMN